jgi:hypothetical protein
MNDIAFHTPRDEESCFVSPNHYKISSLVDNPNNQAIPSMFETEEPMRVGRAMESHCNDQCDGMGDDDEFDNGALSTNFDNDGEMETTNVFDRDDDFIDFDALENYMCEAQENYIFNPDESYPLPSLDSKSSLVDDEEPMDIVEEVLRKCEQENQKHLELP